jgi:putative addiction module antidote
VPLSTDASAAGQAVEQSRTGTQIVACCSALAPESHRLTTHRAVYTFIEHRYPGGALMIKEVKFRQYGGSLGTTLPKAMTDRFNISAGDRVYAVETENGILLTPYDPDFLRVMEAEARISKQYQNALRELAK